MEKITGIAVEVRAVRGRKLQDRAICPPCPNIHVCLGKCPPLVWIDGDKARHESLLRDDIYGERDYNDSLSELMADRESKDTERLELIRRIMDPRKRLIAAGIFVDMTQEQVADALRISQQMISRIIREKK